MCNLFSRTVVLSYILLTVQAFHCSKSTPTFQINIVFDTWSHSVAQTGLELIVLMPQFPEYWDYRHAPRITILKVHFGM
jgi:hypothetical protein